MAQRRLNVAPKVLVAGHFNRSLLYCGAYLFITTPCVHWPPTCPCRLAPNTLTGPHSRCPCHARAFRRVTTCRARAPGAQWRPVVSPLNCSLLPWLPIHPGQLEPTTLPQHRLAPDSCSVGLSPTLSLSLSPAPPPPPSLSLSLSLSPLSLSLLLSVPPKPFFLGAGGQATMSCWSLLIRRHLRNISESRIRVV